MNDLEFSTQLSNIDLKQKTIEQLTKDCYLVGIEVDLKVEQPVEELLQTFETALKESEALIPGKIQQLAYRISFPEKVYHKLELDTQINFTQEIAYEFLMFELKKVLARKKYS